MECRHCCQDRCLLTTSKSTCYLPDEKRCSMGYGKGIIRYLKHIGTYDKYCRIPKYVDPFYLLKNGILKKGTRIKANIAGFENDFTSIDDAFILRARPGELESDSVAVLIGGKTFDTVWITEIEGLE